MSEYIRYFNEMDKEFRRKGLNPNGYSLRNWNSEATQTERKYFQQKLMYRIHGSF